MQFIRSNHNQQGHGLIHYFHLNMLVRIGLGQDYIPQRVQIHRCFYHQSSVYFHL
jgi:hypothetical protein